MKRGFTLVELLKVAGGLALLGGVVAAALIPGMMAYRSASTSIGEQVEQQGDPNYARRVCLRVIQETKADLPKLDDKTRATVEKILALCGEAAVWTMTIEECDFVSARMQRAIDNRGDGLTAADWNRLRVLGERPAGEAP